MFYFNLIGFYTVYLIWAAPLAGGMVCAYFYEGNYREAVLNGLISFLPFLLVLSILFVLILNISYDETLLIGNVSNDFIQLMPVFILVILLIIISVLGSSIGFFFRNRFKSL
jgi:hypothetical protein